MAIIIADEYQGRSNPASAAYPYGSIKNKSAAEVDDGTPLDQKWGNDLEGFFQALLSAANIYPSGTPDQVGASQRYDALVKIIRRFGVPTGGIITWSGSIATIPSGWALCNGTNGTPDLRNRFIVGAGATYAVGNAGGGGTITTTSAGAHGHTTDPQGAHGHGIGVDPTTLTTGQIPSHEHFTSKPAVGGAGHIWTGDFAVWGDVNMGPVTVRSGPEGGGGAHGHTASSSWQAAHTHNVYGVSDHTHNVTVAPPPYYALAYIMKLPE